MNEWYVRDTSRKIKSVLHAKGMDGKHLTSNAIYGYKGTCRGSCDMSRPYTWTATTISDIVSKPE